MWKILEKLGAIFSFSKNSSCSKLGIPSYLHIKNRTKNNLFLDDERIYRRFTAQGNVEDWKKSNTISASIFPIENDSTNRSKYSRKPEDVLYNTREQDNGKHYMAHGIVALKVENFRALSLDPLRVNGQIRNFKLHLEHEPISCMYPHTEIWVMEGDKRVDDKPPKSVRSAARLKLVEICEVVKLPSAESK